MTSPPLKEAEPREALLLVDVQNDFLPPAGALPVSGGRDILPFVRSLVSRPEGWDMICASLDSHPEGHVSFASSHDGRKPFEVVHVPATGDAADGGDEIDQMLWPNHCVVDTEGWQMERTLTQLLEEKKSAGVKVEVVRKGTSKIIDAYSAFSDNDYTLFTQLPRLLFQHRITHLTVVGLALDYCVRASVLDARKFGFEVCVPREGTRAVKGENAERVFDELRRKGVTVV